jgi:hypothetical protein
LKVILFVYFLVNRKRNQRKIRKRCWTDKEGSIPRWKSLISRCLY